MFLIGKSQGAMAPLQSVVPVRDLAEHRAITAIHSVRDLGAALWVTRKALGLTQADLALAAGVGLRFVVELEAGKPTVRLELVLRVIDALGGTLQLDNDSNCQESRCQERYCQESSGQ